MVVARALTKRRHRMKPNDYRSRSWQGYETTVLTWKRGSLQRKCRSSYSTTDL